MPSHATFGAEIGENSGTLPQILGKTDAVWSHVTMRDAAEPFNVLLMCPMSDDAVSNQLLSPHLCVAMPLFGLRLAESSAPCLKFWAKLMLFGGM